MRCVLKLQNGEEDLISVFVSRDISGLVSVTKYGFKDWKFLSSSPETLLFGKYRNTVVS